jgi:hypothetical protein
MPTIREQILAVITQKLDTAAAVTAPVWRSRVTPLARGEAPAIIVEPSQDVASQPVISKIDWSLTVRISVIVRSDVPDQSADSIVDAIHKTLVSDLTLGGLCYDLQPQTTTFELLDADSPTGVISSDFLVLYRTSLTDISLV